MDLELLALFAATEFLLCLTPGPAVLYVASLSMRAGSRAGWAAAAGVTAGSACYFGLSALGVGALILASYTLFTIVKWVGAAYLVYLGIRMIVPLIRRRPDEAISPTGQVAIVARRFETRKGLWRAFYSGFAVQLANPKSLVFFIALFPQFVDPAGNVPLQFAIMAVVSAAMEMPILMAYALVSAASAKLLAERAMVWLEGAAGGILVFIGGALALARDR